jgi:putative transposase
MPRRSRIVLADRPHHIVQRGHNRQAVFAADEDYQYYLANLEECKTGLGCKVYAYCLMTNHVHLIVDPGKRTKNLALLMKSIKNRGQIYFLSTE